MNRKRLPIIVLSILLSFILFGIVNHYRLQGQVTKEVSMEYEELTMESFVNHYIEENPVEEVVEVEEITKPKVDKQLLGHFEMTSYTGAVGHITATGFDLRGHTRDSSRCIAVDPTVIELGSTLYIEFPSPYESFNGEYIANDTGAVIKGRILDLYMGDRTTYQQSIKFGRRQVKVWLVGDKIEIN